jgi:hypothetical protein
MEGEYAADADLYFHPGYPVHKVVGALYLIQWDVTVQVTLAAEAAAAVLTEELPPAGQSHQQQQQQLCKQLQLLGTLKPCLSSSSSSSLPSTGLALNALTQLPQLVTGALLQLAQQHKQTAVGLQTPGVLLSEIFSQPWCEIVCEIGCEIGCELGCEIGWQWCAD